MKNYVLLLLLLVFNVSFSQNETDSPTNNPIDSTIKKEADPKETDSIVSSFNNYRWRLEFGIGDSRGITPYTDGYYSSNSQKKFGLIEFNSVNIGASYIYSELLAFKLDFAFDRFSNKDPKSLPFEVAQYRTSLQGVFNLNSLLKYQKESSRFNILFHGGFTISILQKIKSDINPVVGSKELNGGVVIGFTPMFRITKKSYIFFDFSSFHNYRQHYAWDGNYSEARNNLSGQMINGTFGITYSLGKKLKWESKDIKKLEEDNVALEKRVVDLETMMKDADKDGVADYLDSENNSLAGAKVDSRGIMVDTNKNGVPDELEKYLKDTYVENSNISKEIQSANDDFLKRSINEGYITIFFDTNSSKPVASSSDNINFIVTYLKANPTISMDIIGYSDEIGTSDKNERLALERANSVKNVLVKAGIDPSRLNTISRGEDTSVDPNSPDARQIVRKVKFKIR